MTLTWKESLLSTTDPLRLVAFASYAAGSLSSRELDAAQTRLRRLPTEGLIDLHELRLAALNVAKEASDIIDEQRFFGNRSVSREGWDEWWVTQPAQEDDEQPQVAAPIDEKRYFINTVLGKSEVMNLRDAVSNFKAHHNHVAVTLCSVEGPRVVAVTPKGGLYWRGYPDTTQEEFEALRA